MLSILLLLMPHLWFVIPIPTALTSEPDVRRHLWCQGVVEFINLPKNKKVNQLITTSPPKWSTSKVDAQQSWLYFYGRLVIYIKTSRLAVLAPL